MHESGTKCYTSKAFYFMLPYTDLGLIHGKFYKLNVCLGTTYLAFFWNGKSKKMREKKKWDFKKQYIKTKLGSFFFFLLCVYK